ncbi:5-formyltetrahydrofolate cyclo-ligase [Agaribacter flavus]|uniref:5-formyltetrahydrofolate cyclo-ligase n=1 Tax=Agaribacter flavus TaxID=1902781 RepID=A0ABV7FR39_9ALTE
MLEPTTTQLRNSLRQTFRERRKSLSLGEQQEAAEALLEHYKTLPITTGAKRVAIYMTNDGELSTLPLIDFLWSQNIEVYLPVLHPFCDGYLLFVSYTKDSLMLANNFGILEPILECHKICPVLELDIIFTPLVAFDEKGNRLGMGGGFYDRTLEFVSKRNKCESNPSFNKMADVSTQQKNAPTLVGLAHDIQQCLSLPTEAWDIPLPYIVTPTRFFNFTHNM